MRVGLTVSILAHAAVLGFGFLAFPEGHPFEAANIEALPVDLVAAADVTDLLKGDKNSKILPEEKPQPTPTVQAETPAKPAEKPAPKPVDATAPPTPPPVPEPELEPDEKPAEPPPPSEPKPEYVAALPKPAEEVLPPAPKIPVEAPKPKPRPQPPKMAKPKPEKPKPDKKPEFNPDDIAALLNKQTPTGGGDPDPAKDPQTLGSSDGHSGAAMTQSEIEALKAKLYGCWNPPVAVREAGTLVVQVRITLLPDGSLSGQPTISGIAGVSNPLSQVAAEAAIRAVVQCAPFGDILKPENYALWNQIDFVFDPRQMLGG